MDKILSQVKSFEHKVSELLEQNDTFQMLKDELQSLFIGLFVSMVGLATVGILVFWVLR
jgi:hypothetical protein